MTKQFLYHLSPLSQNFAECVRSAETLILYEATLICQLRIAGPEIMQHVKKFSSWKKIKNILEVGCGPGEGAKKLSEYALLQNKNYTGIDLEPYFIDQARYKNLGSNINFIQGDIFTYTQKGFNALLLIAVLQHLGDIHSVALKFRDLIDKDGYVFLFDTLPGSTIDRFEFNPSIPQIAQMYDSISYQKTLGKRNNMCLVEFKEQASKLGFKVIHQERIEMTVLPELREDYIRSIFLASELIKRMYQVDIDQDDLLNRLLYWLSSNGTAILRGWGKLILQAI
ncbi:MAG: class I SAM-dependent methyltransferase [Alphaproteobacteria bacterium]|nr:class I SAM-dependent methyltransferase [Alphaproteobacteria bacterium]